MTFDFKNVLYISRPNNFTCDIGSLDQDPSHRNKRKDGVESVTADRYSGLVFRGLSGSVDTRGGWRGRVALSSALSAEIVLITHS